jgi:hypothetical protein
MGIVDVAALAASAEGGPPSRSDHCYVMLNQIGSERREPVKATFGPAIFDCRILTFDETLFIEATLKCLHELLEWTGCRATEESDRRHHRLLGARN